MASSLPKFPQFVELPMEIRLQIWALAIPDRVLPINLTKGILVPSARRYVKSFHTTSPPPALLLTCHESRSIALSTYTRHFQTADCGPAGGIYISFRHDTISLPDGTITYLGVRELEGIERLALDVKDHAYFGYFNLGALRSMKSLRALELRTHPRDRYSQIFGEVAEVITRDLRAEAEGFPEWEVPEEIRIVEALTGQELGIVRGRRGILPVEEEQEEQ